MENFCPAPWNLTGKGYILLYKFPKVFAEEKANVPEFLKGKFAGGFGALMLVDYSTSDAGPYGELLLIPGKFMHEGKKLNTISKIYVSTMASVINGRRNWGIPKELADFSFQAIDSRTEKVSVTSEETMVAEFILESGKLSFPVNTKLLPFPLVQQYEGKYYYTTFHGSGTGRFAKLKDISVNPGLFPDVSGFRPIAAIKVEPFKIVFPEAKIAGTGNI
ncbi:MAG TPA: acetoacetate decarboxylase family protein [Clostridiaceae bacterium]|nr:acetoacetate decarboxylase family protein [Clostridiaceae bacterium]